MTDLYLDQSDDETVNIGPIIAADGSYLAVTGAFSTTLVVKANKNVADATGTPYVGSFAGSNASGWVATFNVPKANLATLGVSFYRCTVVDGAGKVQTASAGRWIVDTGRSTAAGPSPVTPSALALGLAGKVAKAGDTMSGPLVLPGDATLPLQAVPKQQMDAQSATYVPKWKPFVPVTAGDYYLNPSGQIVSANTTFTTGATYNAANWTAVGGAGATAYARPSMFGGSVPVASRAIWADQGALSNGTDLGGTYRVSHVAACDCTGIRLVFTNAHGVTIGPNAITVTASVEPWNGVIAGILGTIPVTFNGAFAVTLAPGATVVSDPIGVAQPIPAGATFFTRHYVSVASVGMRWPVALVSSLTGEGNNRSATPTDLTQSGTVPAALTDPIFAPVAVLGTATNPSRLLAPQVGAIGDSIMRFGNDMDNGGFVARALRHQKGTLIAPLGGLVNLGRGGESAAQWTTATEPYRRPYVENFTHVISNYGTNDIVGGATLAALQATMLALWTSFAARGQSVWHTTCTPNTTMVSGQATIRANWNDWLRAGAPIDPLVLTAVAVGTAGALLAGRSGHPLAGYFETADAVESARNSNLYATGMNSGDGVHPSALGHIAMAAVINKTSLGITLPTPPSLAAATAISGLICQFDPDLSPPASGSALATITDRSGAGNHATATGTSQPTYQANVVNGHGTFRFDGVNDFATWPDFSALTAGTVIAVIKTALNLPTDGTKTGLWKLGNNNGTYYPFTDGTVYEGFGTTVFKVKAQPVAYNLDTWHVLSAISATNDWRSYFNGGLHNFANAGTGGTTVGFPAVPWLGKSGDSRFLAGDIAYLLIYNRVLTAAERVGIERALGARFNIDVG